MLITAHTTDEALDRALSWATARGVLVELLETSFIDLDPQPPDRPTLYLIKPGVTPPLEWTELEDWIRLPTTTAEIYDRVERLLARTSVVLASTTVVDDDDVLRAGSRLVPLSPMDAELIRLLLDQAGRIVTRQELERSLWPDAMPTDVRALDNRLKRLRLRLVGLPLRIHTVRGRGFLLEHLPVVSR